MTDDIEGVLAALRAALVQLGVAPGTPVPADPVATYDEMRDAATALGALYAGRIGAGGPDDPAVRAMRALDAEVGAVDPTDIAAQRAMTEALRQRYDELATEGWEAER